ncbi:MAG TPA: hypothetical protein VEW74_02215 [Candidatus Nitrosotalea sp.]|nr:hypothetical protein [Candidatus Nitrosotalea sp.]
MKPRSVLTVIVALALGGCGVTLSPSPGGAALDRIATSVARRAAVPRPDRRKSWISPELAHAQAPLLFVSDSGTADVYIYNLSALKLVGTLTGFEQPQGECSDNKGNVWVTDTSAKTIYELSHRGHLENELKDSSGYPVACAWDPTTRNLAVMNLFGTGSNAGAVLVYPPGSSGPSVYTNSAQYYYNFGGYDGNGNLFFDGRNASGNFMLSELPKGENSAHTVSVTGGTIYFPGMVQWNVPKKTLIVGDQSCGNEYVSCLYTLAIGKNGGTIESETSLQNYTGGQVCDLVQGILYGSKIAGSDFDFCGSDLSATYVWSYPTGGKPNLDNNRADSVPVGAAISK